MVVDNGGVSSNPATDAPTIAIEKSGVGTARQPAVSGDTAPVSDEIRAEGPGTTLGRYVVLEEVGRGGMGRVLRAYDPKLQREVALKELQECALSAEGRARLVSEARAMAKLSHSNVVAIYDVDELPHGDETRLTIAMEFVPGSTLQAWLKESRPWQDIMPTLLLAGRGLAAAHAAGLLHRDFKPANVLVGDALGPNVVKVTDFGLAKGFTRDSSTGGTDGHGTEGRETVTFVDAGLTQAGTVLGTPRYMAPEQHAGEELTAAADQYAFCVTMWQALCGESPFSGTSTEIGLLKYEGPPPWPNAAIPATIVDALRRGLAPEPRDRWSSMDELLEALRPRARRRYWAGALGSVAVLAVVGSGTRAMSEERREVCTGAELHMQDVWDDDKRGFVEQAMLSADVPFAQSAWERTGADLDSYAGAWTTMHEQTCAATNLHGEQSVAVMDLRMACLHRAKVALAATTDVLADADGGVIAKAHALTATLPQLERCADVEALRSGELPVDPAERDAVDATSVALAEARAFRTAGRIDSASSALLEAQRLADGVEHGPLQIALALEQGEIRDDEGQYEPARLAFERALELAVAQDQPEQVKRAATALVFVVGARLQRNDEAQMRYGLLARRTPTDKPVLQASALSAMGTVQEDAGDHEAARELYAEALEIWTSELGENDPSVARGHANLARALELGGDLAEAEAEQRRALRIELAMLGPDHPATATTRDGLGLRLSAQGKHEAAAAEHRIAASVRERVLRPGHPHIALSRSNLAGALYMEGRYSEAEAVFRTVIKELAVGYGAASPRVAMARGSLAITLQLQEDYAGAESEYQLALDALVKARGADHPLVARVRDNLATAFHVQGKFEEAEAEYRTGLSNLEARLKPDNPRIAMSLHNYGSLLAELGRDEEALVMAERAYAIRLPSDLPPEHRAESSFLLGRVLWNASVANKDKQRAHALCREAIERLADATPSQPEETKKIRTWIETHPLMANNG